MRIVEVIHDNRKGGISSRAMSTATPLRQHGVESIFVLPKENGDVAAAVKNLGFEVHQITLHRPHPRRVWQTIVWAATFPLSMLSLARVLRMVNPDVIHVNGFLGLQAIAVAALTRTPVVWHLAGTASYPRWLVACFRPVLTNLAHLVTISEEVRKFYLGTRPKNAREAILHEPIDADGFVERAADSGSSVREEYDISPDKLVVTTVGNLSPVKGHEFLVAAAAKLCADRDDMRFMLVGQPLETQKAYVGMIRRAIRENGLDRKFHLLGRRDDISAILAATDIFVLPSLSEGTPISILEAMAHGLPVVATQVGGIPEQVEEGRSGLLVPAGDPAMLKAALAKLADSAEMRRSFGQNGWTKVRREFSMASFLESFVAVLKHARGEGRGMQLGNMFRCSDRAAGASRIRPDTYRKDM